ncbi:m7GpppX diphosphatase [Zancudomyces culisetae]|uniref:m7GpppX diphosphatase n=1 Tax=Zancudomyces culisetae TaxID=1213189 RepID=A0A1R1PJI8_ZANCU|nr:m7GpppX diphosphatase [Zancudomyces culisetae]OMH81130.1 m7GpppX diphosphatase [Zancudomyces culisetae]|eukprot:OMH79332.1 m7GpppX diphosphatase [Zancudomyces culisetae]
MENQSIIKKLHSFVPTQIINEDVSTKRIVFLGHLEGVEGDKGQALLIAERIHFKFDISRLNKKIIQSTHFENIQENDIYGWAEGCLFRTDIEDSDGITKSYEPQTKFMMIHPATQKHIDKYMGDTKKYLEETPELYKLVTKKYIESEDLSRTSWVYNILEGKAEVDRVVYKDTDPNEGFVLLPDSKWDGITLKTLYLVALVNDRSIKSLRDLTSKHVGLLKNIRHKSMETIKCRYPGITESDIMMFVHYLPSYYHFHVHIINVNFDAGSVSANVGRAHLIDSIINNIQNISPSYYQNTSLYISVNNKMYNMFQHSE